MKTIEQLKAEIKATEDGLLKKVLENNLKAAAFNEDVINTVYTVFNKYAGKKIGDRTLEKINAELKNSYSDIRVYFSWNWDHSEKTGINVTRYDSTHPELSYTCDSIEIYRKTSHNLFDENSAFIAIDRESTRISGRVNYIEDVETYVTQKTEQFKAVTECINQYRELVKSFRENGVRGLADFNHISVPYRITE